MTNYIDEFRDPAAARGITANIRLLAERLPARARPWAIMEVCGSHTMAIARFGIRSLLPKTIELISGPGCPVCVTDMGYIDAAVELAAQGHCIVTFGDMLRVPGSQGDLARARVSGGSVQICYSPLETLELAVRDPSREFVFLAVGFETTIPAVLCLIEQAEKRGITNVSLLTAFKAVIPAMELLASSPDIQVDAFLAPAHVSAIIGSDAYKGIVERFHLPSVVAGFEPLDILFAIQRILEQFVSGEALAENHYSRVVRPAGNRRAQQLMERYLEPVDADWRGLGRFPKSGYGLRSEFVCYDAERKLGIKVREGRTNPKCRCGDVLKGVIKPPQCELFGRGCTPEHPVGACMVSLEGSCSAYYKYQGIEGL